MASPSGHQQENAALRAENVALKVRVAALETESAAREKRVAALEVESAAQKERIGDLERQTEPLQYPASHGCDRQTRTRVRI